MSKEFQRIPEDSKGFPKHLKGIPEGFQSMSKELQRISKHYKGIPKDFKVFQKDFKRISKDFKIPKDFQELLKDFKLRWSTGCKSRSAYAKAMRNLCEIYEKITDFPLLGARGPNLWLVNPWLLLAAPGCS